MTGTGAVGLRGAGRREAAGGSVSMAVVCEWSETGRDCDGRYERGGELFCPLADLAARDAHWAFPIRENVGIRAPVWQRATSYQRDHAAEAAGY